MSYDRYPAESYPGYNSPRGLPCPVVIPQRRPGDKGRGFILAYAPVLEQCDIDHEVWLEFLRSCNKAVQGSPVLSAVEVAAFGVSMAPELIVMSVATAAGIVVNKLNKQWAQWKTNSFLDKWNKELFRPRGLYCLLMTYNSHVEEDERRTEEGHDLSQRLSWPSSSSGTGLTARVRRNMRDPFNAGSDGTYRLPESVAPLVYLDTEIVRADPEESDPGANKLSRADTIKKTFTRFENYLDRRAQAKYAKENPSHVLTALRPPVTRGFSNRYLDPTHPATNNGLMGLLSGGAITQNPEKKGRRRLTQYEDEALRLRSEHERRLDDIQRSNCSPRDTRARIVQEEEDFRNRMAEIDRRKGEEDGRQRKKVIK